MLTTRQHNAILESGLRKGIWKQRKHIRKTTVLWLRYLGSKQLTVQPSLSLKTEEPARPKSLTSQQHAVTRTKICSTQSTAHINFGKLLLFLHQQQSRWNFMPTTLNKQSSMKFAHRFPQSGPHSSWRLTYSGVGRCTYEQDFNSCNQKCTIPHNSSYWWWWLFVGNSNWT